MDKHKMNYVATILFEHMKIGMFFCIKQDGLVFNEIELLLKRLNISTAIISSVLEDLVSRGILTVNFGVDYQLNYVITEFGSYFYKKLCSTNEDIAALFEKVGVIINETDFT